jgi:hypothetical protein
MSKTIIIIELKRYGWSQKILRKSFVIMGSSPHVGALKLQEVWTRVLPHKSSGKSLNSEDLGISNCASARQLV